LSITNEWVRHADSKTGVTLAFVAVTATALFNLVDGHHSWTRPLMIATAAGVLAIVCAIVFAALALLPRVKQPIAETAIAEAKEFGVDPSVNLLFFADVRRKYRDDKPTYREVLGTLTADPAALTGQIADQVHANAHIATVKYRHTNRAIVCELIAVTMVVTVVFLLATGW
jgi:hypothetical protein